MNWTPPMPNVPSLVNVPGLAAPDHPPPGPPHPALLPSRRSNLMRTMPWNPMSNITTHVSKRAKVSDDKDSFLSRAEVAKLIGMVVMELQSIQNALDRTWESLVNFTSQANGK